MQPSQSSGVSVLLLLTTSVVQIECLEAQGGEAGAEACDFLAQRVNQEAGSEGEREESAEEHT